MLAQDKIAEVKFWDRRALKDSYIAFRDEEYIAVLKLGVGEDIKDKKILCIGCASGKECILFLGGEADVYGIDISPLLIGQAKQMWGGFGDKVKFSVGDAEELKFSDDYFDICYYAGVLHHLPERKQALKEALRVLKHGGKLVAVEPNKRDFLERIGFHMARLRGDLSPNEGPIDPRELTYELSLIGFKEIKFGIIRPEIPWLCLYLPKLSFRIVQFINKWRNHERRGTFFMMNAVKP